MWTSTIFRASLEPVSFKNDQFMPRTHVWGGMFYSSVPFLSLYVHKKLQGSQCASREVQGRRPEWEEREEGRSGSVHNEDYSSKRESSRRDPWLVFPEKAEPEMKTSVEVVYMKRSQEGGKTKWIRQRRRKTQVSHCHFHQSTGVSSLCVGAQSCSYALWPHGMQPFRLLCPWGSPGKSTGVGCHFFLQGIFPTQESNKCLL